MAGRWQQKRVLIAVRTYPVPARKGIEVSCTAGVTAEGEWVRLFPVPYRFLSDDKRFRKYQWIDVNVRKAGDTRPESYNLDIDSIQICGAPLSTREGWRERREVLSPLKAHCMCCIQRERDANKHPTLGFFKPGRITELLIEKVEPNWTSQELARLRQHPIWVDHPDRELEKIPFRFSYRYECPEVTCNGHEQVCTDWEIGQAFRKYQRTYGRHWEAKFRARFEREMIERNDTHFYVGTVHQFPASFIVVGLWYPRLQPQGRLFD